MFQISINMSSTTRIHKPCQSACTHMKSVHTITDINFCRKLFCHIPEKRFDFLACLIIRYDRIRSVLIPGTVEDNSITVYCEVS